VEGGVDLGGQERQEFSFTLYDFDGHGKITKDVSLSQICAPVFVINKTLIYVVKSR
jgi:hypothetical protein